MKKSALELLQEYRNIVAETYDSSPVFRAIMRRLENAYPDVFTQYGYDVVEEAVNDQASFVGNVEEIGSSDISGWTRQVLDMLKRNELGAGVE